VNSHIKSILQLRPYALTTVSHRQLSVTLLNRVHTYTDITKQTQGQFTQT